MNAELGSLLVGSHPSGIVRSRAGDASRLEAAGWSVVRIDAVTKAGFLDACADALAFPAYFGHNLDALLDLLRERDEPTALAWTGWDRLRGTHPRDWTAIHGVLEQRVTERPGFAVLLIE